MERKEEVILVGPAILIRPTMAGTFVDKPKDQNLLVNENPKVGDQFCIPAWQPTGGRRAQEGLAGPPQSGGLTHEDRDCLRKTNARAVGTIAQFGDKDEIPSTEQSILNGAPNEDLKREYLGFSDGDAALLESTRRNVARAKVLLAQACKLSKSQVPALQLHATEVLANAASNLALALEPFDRASALVTRSLLGMPLSAVTEEGPKKSWSHSLANEGFNPDEPRVPAGQPGCGQWVAGGTAKPAPAPTPLAAAVQRMSSTDKESRDAKTAGQAGKEAGSAYVSTLFGLLRSIFHPDGEPSKSMNFFQLQDEVDEAVDGMDMTTAKGLGRAMALATVMAAADALSDGAAESSGPSLSVVLERGPQGVMDQLSSTLEPGTLSNAQARDWYNATKVVRADIIDKMRAAGYSEEEIAHEAFELRNAARTKARELMKDREKAAAFKRKNPNLTWEEVVTKYNGDYELVIKKSLESNEQINKMVEQLRQKH